MKRDHLMGYRAPTPAENRRDPLTFALLLHESARDAEVMFNDAADIAEAKRVCALLDFEVGDHETPEMVAARQERDRQALYAKIAAEAQATKDRPQCMPPTMLVQQSPDKDLYWFEESSRNELRAYFDARIREMKQIMPLSSFMQR